ncbi:tripartite tricarboxylate transporter permease [Pseudomonadota bacterium]
MLESYLLGIQSVMAADVLIAIAAAVPIGLTFGLLPGLSGLTALAVLLPLVYGMEPLVGLAFLLAAHAVIYTGGSMTTILLGIPGSPPNAATLLDGRPMALNGEAGRAVGAALAASGLGGLIGVVALLLLIPVVQPVIVFLGSPEIFCLSLLGISYIALIGRGDLVKGLAAGGFGIFLSCFGYQDISGVPRFWSGSDYLLDGFRLVPLVLGMFAIPEIVDLATSNRQRAPIAPGSVDARSLWHGARDVLVRRWLLLRSAWIGVLVGLIPGVGGDTAPFIAYGSARQWAREPSRFGSGIVDGVIAPEASNNAKEGGALVPTLALGIPGSAGMVLLLGGFLLLGLQPGIGFLDDHADTAVALALVLALANVLAVIVMFGAARFVVRLLDVRRELLAGPLLVLVVLGAYTVEQNTLDVLFVLVFGVLGCCMRNLDYSRPALLLGFVLGPTMETYLHISMQAYGYAFLLRPGVLIILFFIVAGFAGPVFRRYRVNRIRSDHGPS